MQRGAPANCRAHVNVASFPGAWHAIRAEFELDLNIMDRSSRDIALYCYARDNALSCNAEWCRTVGMEPGPVWDLDRKQCEKTGRSVYVYRCVAPLHVACMCKLV